MFKTPCTEIKMWFMSLVNDKTVLLQEKGKKIFLPSIHKLSLGSKSIAKQLATSNCFDMNLRNPYL